MYYARFVHQASQLINVTVSANQRFEAFAISYYRIVRILGYVIKKVVTLQIRGDTCSSKT